MTVVGRSPAAAGTAALWGGSRTPPGRVERIWPEMRRSGLDALVVGGRGALGQHGCVEYVAGYSSLGKLCYAVVFTQARPVLVVGSREEADHVRIACGDVDVLFDDRGSGLGPVVSAVLRERLAPGATVGIVGRNDVIPAAGNHALSGLDEFTCTDATDILTALAARPDVVDLDLYRAAGEVAAEGLREFQRLIRPGASLAVVCARVEGCVRELGGRHPIVLLGRGPFFQRISGDGDLVADGDLLSAYVELAGPGGVWVEEVRLFQVGAQSRAQEHLAESATTAMTGAVALLEPGRHVADVAARVRRLAADAGLEIASTGVVGHGVGLGDRGFGVLGVTRADHLPGGAPVALHPTLVTADRATAVTVGGTFLVAEGGGTPLSDTSVTTQPVLHAGPAAPEPASTRK